jgi:DNA modification methylase
MSALPSDVVDVLEGRRRWAVLCADNAEVLPLLPDKSVDHVITDPPYTQRTSDGARSAPHGVNGSRLGEARAYIDFGGVDGLEGWIAGESVRLAARWAVIFCALEQLGAYAAAPGWVRASAWLRTNSAPQFTGDRPGQALEGIAILHRAGRKRWNRGGDCWAPVGPTVSSFGDPNRGQTGHPTPKPEWLMVECLEAFTDPGELVLDPFAGSGTTGVAAIRLGRRCILIEKSEQYAAVARERMEAESQGITLRAARAGQLSLLGGQP